MFTAMFLVVVLFLLFHLWGFEEGEIITFLAFVALLSFKVVVWINT